MNIKHLEKISVIIPTYNRAKLLVAAIESVLTQTMRVDEVLVCDDGSTDDSEEKVKTIADPRIRWLNCGRNGMPSIPRNLGIAASQGDWLAFLDSDDTWHAEKIAKQFALVQQHQVRACCTNAFRIPGKGNMGNYQNESIPELFSTKELLQTNLVICSSAMIHRSLLSAVKGFPESPSLKAIEDYAFWLRVGTLTKFAHTKESLVYYNDDSTTSIRSEDDDTWIQREKIFDDFYQWCESTPVVEKHWLPAARHEVQRAMKMNGKGFFARWRYGK